MSRFYVLNDQGDFERLEMPGTLKGVPVNFDPAIIAALRSALPFWIKNWQLNQEHGNMISLCVLGSDIYVSCALRELKIKANWRADEKTKLLLPAWGDKTFPEMNMVWTPPKDMQLRFILQATTDPTKTGYNDGRYCVQRVFLVAFDSNRNAYQLPLPNLYSDGRICLPDPIVKVNVCLYDMFAYFYRVISDSLWNNHLIKEDGKNWDLSPEIFRFEPDENGFKQAPIKKEWNKACKTMGHSSLQYFLP